jgi:hypothetical protein
MLTYKDYTPTIKYIYLGFVLARFYGIVLQVKQQTLLVRQLINI